MDKKILEYIIALLNIFYIIFQVAKNVPLITALAATGHTEAVAVAVAVHVYTAADVSIIGCVLEEELSGARLTPTSMCCMQSG